MSMDRLFKSDSKEFISPPVVLSKFLEQAAHAEDDLYKVVGMEDVGTDVRDQCRRLFSCTTDQDNPANEAIDTVE